MFKYNGRCVWMFVCVFSLFNSHRSWVITLIHKYIPLTSYRHWACVVLPLYGLCIANALLLARLYCSINTCSDARAAKDYNSCVVCYSTVCRVNQIYSVYMQANSVCGRSRIWRGMPWTRPLDRTFSMQVRTNRQERDLTTSYKHDAACVDTAVYRLRT